MSWADSRSARTHSRSHRESHSRAGWLWLLKTHTGTFCLGCERRLQVASQWYSPSPRGPAELREARKLQAEDPCTDIQEAKRPSTPTLHPPGFLFGGSNQRRLRTLLLSTSFVPLQGGPLPDGAAECWNKHLGCCQLGNGREFLKGWGVGGRNKGVGEMPPHRTLSFLPRFWHCGNSWASKSKRITWARIQEQMSKLLQKRGKHCTF